MSAETRGALARFKQTGRKLILVTGRNLPDLKRVFPELQLFDRVVAENGALIYDPATNEERPLAAAPSPAADAMVEGGRPQAPVSALSRQTEGR